MQTCSGEPIPADELKKREQERMEKKRRKQEERMKRIEEKKKISGGKNSNGDCASRVSSLSDIDGNNSESEIDVVGEEPTGRGSEEQEKELDLSVPSRTCQEHHEQNVGDQGNGLKPALLGSAFSIDSLLETPKVPRGRRPNSKYPRVQASKSMNPLSLGMYPLYPITQPMGFQVERPPTPTSTSCTSVEPSPEPLRRFSSPSSLKLTNQLHQPRYGMAREIQTEITSDKNIRQSADQSADYAKDSDKEDDEEVEFLRRKNISKKPNGLVPGF